MGYKEYLDDHQSELPAQAGDATVRQFEPDDNWIESAPRELQIEAMRRWFCGRYEDPANEVPYDDEDGEYVFIWGGPYDPRDKIQGRFDHVVPHDVMEELIHDLYSEVGDSWAPIDHEGVDYDDELSMFIVHRSDPYQMMSERLTKVENIVAITGNSATIQSVIPLAHSAAITALEAYLWDTVSYWARNNDATLRTLVATNSDFETKTLRLSTIFTRLEGINKEVEAYLQNVIWHRLDKVKPMMEKGLNIKLPEIGDLMREVLMRHDIVHRGGRNKDGMTVTASANDVHRAVAAVRAFADAIERELAGRYIDDNLF